MKKALSILAIMCVSVALFAAAGTTVKIGAAYDNFKTTVPKDLYGYETYTTGDGFGVEAAVQYDMPGKTMFFVDFNIVFFQDAMAQDDLPGSRPESVKQHYSVFRENEKNQYFFNFFSYSFGVAKRFDMNSFSLFLGGGFTMNRLWLKSTATDGFDVIGIAKREYKITDTIFGITAYVEGKAYISRTFGISVAAKPQVGIYNKHVVTDTVTYTNGELKPSVTKKQVKDFVISYAMPVSVCLAFSF